jgi:hypothetical protein
MAYKADNRWAHFKANIFAPATDTTNRTKQGRLARSLSSLPSLDVHGIAQVKQKETYYTGRRPIAPSVYTTIAMFI